MLPIKARKTIKQFIPPIILNLLKRKEKYGFFGNYSSWLEAKNNSIGYDSDLILEKVKQSALRVKNGQAAYERDSVIFEKIDYSWPLLALLLWLASQNNNKLNLIDFGGSLGTSYFQNINFLKHLVQLQWNIIEQKNFVDCGKKYFQDNNLKFFYTIEECIAEYNPKIILLSSVLQYLEKPYEFLKKIINLKFNYIIFDKTVFLANGDDRLVVQRVPLKIYPASYPCWLFNLEKFINFFKGKYQLISDFDSPPCTTIKLNENTASYRGFCFKKIF